MWMVVNCVEQLKHLGWFAIHSESGVCCILIRMIVQAPRALNWHRNKILQCFIFLENCQNWWQKFSPNDSSRSRKLITVLYFWKSRHSWFKNANVKPTSIHSKTWSCVFSPMRLLAWQHLNSFSWCLQQIEQMISQRGHIAIYRFVLRWTLVNRCVIQYMEVLNCHH